MIGLRLRKVYGKPWSKLADGVPLSRDVLDRLGKALVDAIVREARKDLAKQGMSPTPKGQPEGLPVSDSFFDSFSYEIVGESTVAVTSTWPWVEQHVEGRDPYPMKWLTRQNGVNAVPMVQPNGTVLVRYAPSASRTRGFTPGSRGTRSSSAASRRAGRRWPRSSPARS